MVDFSYTGQLSNRYSKNKETDFLFNVQVYVLGEKYGIQALKTHITSRFVGILRRYLDGGSTWTRETIADLASALTEIYRATPMTDPELRDVVIPVVHPHIEEFLDNPEISEMMSDTPGISAFLFAKSDDRRET